MMHGKTAIKKIICNTFTLSESL